MFRGAVMAVVLGLASLPAGTAAREIGVTSAVLPRASGTPPQEPTRILQVGNDIYADERIRTVDKGKVHLLFLDGSAMSIGPNSDIVLDEFVYDPKTRDGKLAFAATKGLFRFVGGRISKVNPVLIRTPDATIGIRGGVALISIGAVIRATLIYGDELFIRTAGRVYTVKTPGFRLQVEADGYVGAPVAATSRDLGARLTQLEGNSSQSGAIRSLVTKQDVSGSQISSLGSNLSPQLTGTVDTAQAPLAEAAASGEVLADQTGVDDATVIDRGQSVIDGVANNVTASGLAGMYRHATTRGNGTDIGGSLDDLLNNGTVIGGTAAATAIGGGFVSYPVSTLASGGSDPGAGSYLDYDTSATTSSLFGPIAPGRSFIADSGEFTFVFADETDFTGHAVFAFFGKPTSAAAIPTTGVVRYSLQRDRLLDGDVPFAAALQGADFGLGGDDIGDAFINWQPNGAGERAFAGARQAAPGNGNAAATSLIVGKVLTDSTGQPFLVGKMRGAIRTSTDTTTRTIFLSSSAATVDGAGGADFFGSVAPDFFVLDSSTADSADATVSGGVSATQATAVAFADVLPNVPALRVSDGSVGQTRTPRTLMLETGGISSDWSASGAQSMFRRFVTNEADPTASRLMLNANGSISAVASIASLDGGLGNGTNIRFGGTTANSAFVADRLYGAVESDTASTHNGTAVIGQTLYFYALNNGLSEVVSDPATVCTCAFLDFGIWGGQIRADSTHEHEFFDNYWIAGPPVTAADFPSGGTATYVGNAIATVFDNGSFRDAAGDFTANVSFSPGNVNLGSVTIDVDGAVVTLSGTGSTPGPFPLSGSGTRAGGPVNAVAKARFAGDSGTLQNMYGTFGLQATDDDYRQAGVFGAQRQ